MGRSDGIVQVRRDIAAAFLDLEYAIPLGFIVTEVISNAPKHAFPQGTSGTIRFTFGSRGTGEYEMIVADDGVGLPEQSDLVEAGSLGMKLVKMFVAQLRAEMQIIRHHGTEFRIVFSTDPRS